MTDWPNGWNVRSVRMDDGRPALVADGVFDGETYRHAVIGVAGLPVAQVMRDWMQGVTA